MQTNTKTTRSEELRQAIAAATAELEQAQEALGSSVADDDEPAAAEARADVARLRSLIGELEAARPIALRREAQARREAEEKARRERERQANKARAAQVAAARKVDKLMAQLGRAYAEYQATEPGGDSAAASRLSRRSRYAATAALFHAAPEFAREVIEPHVRPMRAHHTSLADAVGKTVREFAGVEDDAE